MNPSAREGDSSGCFREVRAAQRLISLARRTQAARRRTYRKYLGGELNSPVAQWLNKGVRPCFRPNTDAYRGGSLVEIEVILAPGRGDPGTWRLIER